jgi:oligopeptidase B
MKRIFFSIALMASLFVLNAVVTPPVAPVHPCTTSIHGHTLIDNYAWLKDKTRSNPEVLHYLAAENAYTDSMMAHTASMQKQLYSEFLARMQEIDESVPTRIDSFYYYTRLDADSQYRVYCRKKWNLDADEEIYLDVNQLAKGHPFFSLGDISMSPNHRYLAYSTDITGAEQFTLHILDLQTGQLLNDTAFPISGITWANDNATIFYATDDESGRSWQVYRHRMGTPASSDEMLYQETDGSFYAYTYRTLDRKYIILGTTSKTTAEYYYLSADEPDGTFTRFRPRQKNLDYYLLTHDDDVYVVTNDNAPNRRIMKTSFAHSDEPWQEVIPHRSDVRISASITRDYLFINEKQNGLNNIRIHHLHDTLDQYITFNEPVYSASSWSPSEYDQQTLRYGYESLTTPWSVREYDIKNGTTTVLKQQYAGDAYQAEEYTSQRLFATASDGTAIPISLVYRTDLFAQDGSCPMLLDAYGSYGDSNDPYFSRTRLSLLDRGVIYAIAHVRGGGEMGRHWYDEGRMFNKKNTFTDFITCAQHCIQQGYTSASKLVITGGSAGGLLMGAVLNMQPQLFHAAIADVPFVDVINTMQDTTLSAVVSEYEEWGNPQIKEQFEYIFSYCPYQNVTAQNYPAMLVLGGFFDTRVNYWEPAKWTAKLRATKTDTNILLLHTNMTAGHSGSSGRYDYLEEIAFTYAFIFDTLGIEF